jgi:glycosyltransferase involved in cell wall biosynthesis
VNVLQIVHFNVPDEPHSGGAIRMRAIEQTCREAGAGFRRVEVHARRAPAGQPWALTLSWWARHRRRHLGPPSGLEPLRLLWASEDGRTLAARLARQVGADALRGITVLLIEHPWLLGLARALRDQGHCPSAALVYSSHNIEWRLHEAHWRRQNAWTAAAGRLVAAIRRAEAEAAAAADLTLAVCEADAFELREQGAKQVLVLCNGVHAPPAVSVPAWAPEALHGRPYVLFVASDFWPNISGFDSWMPSDFSHWPAGQVVAVAGRVGAALRRQRRWSAAFEQGRIVDLGVLSRDHLAQAIAQAHALILPIGDGAGTNLKTAEALVSGRPIVATPISLRGFEAHAQHPCLHLAETPAAFDAAMQGALAQREADLHDARAQLLLWPRTLAPLVPALAALQPSRPAAGYTVIPPDTSITAPFT